MTPEVPLTDALLQALPKTDLHCHLDGSLRLRTMLELAEEQKVRLPADSEEGLARAMKIGQRHPSLEEYLKGFEITLSVLQTDAALFRAAYELALDAAAENVRLLEVRYAPVLQDAAQKVDFPCSRQRQRQHRPGPSREKIVRTLAASPPRCKHPGK